MGVDEMRRKRPEAHIGADVNAREIRVDDLQGQEIAFFLAEHVAEMRAVTPLESKHALDLDGLRQPQVTFWTVHQDGELVGCGAIKQIEPGHGEIKSMRVARSRKRTGIAGMLLNHMIAEAGAMSLNRLSLETGSSEHFLPARRLYERFGFVYCEPFGDYKADPNSVHMTRAVGALDHGSPR